MIRLGKWLPTQVADKWDVFSPAIETALPPTAGNSPSRMNHVLENILSGHLTVYVIYEVTDDNYDTVGVLTVTPTEAHDSPELSLLIYSLTSFINANRLQIVQVYNALKDVAKLFKCTSISGYTKVPALVDYVKMLKGSADFTYLKLEV